MKIFKRLSDWNTRVKSRLDVKNRFPLWVNQYVSRTILVLIILIVGVNLYLDDFSPATFSLECDEPECLNPFYGYNIFYGADSFKGYSCEELHCDSEYLYEGFSVGRTDVLAKHGIALMIFLFLSIFPLSRLFNAIKQGEQKCK